MRANCPPVCACCQVTFQVRELSRVVGGVNTMVSENEGNLVLGTYTPWPVWERARVRARACTDESLCRCADAERAGARREAAGGVQHGLP